MIKIKLPFPPSVNTYWRSFRGRNILSKAAREYRKAAIDAAKEYSGLYCDGQLVKVSLFLKQPTIRVIDCDNRAKAVLDSLTHAGVWSDDSQVDELYIKRCGVDIEKKGYVIVEIEAIP